MKPALSSFLFFYLALWSHVPVNAQVADSLTYYTQVITRPVEPDDLAKAYQFFITEKARHEGIASHLVNEVYAIQNLARIQKKLGYTSESEKLHLEALEILSNADFDTEWNKTSYRSSINELGKIYREKRDYDRALDLYNEALETTTSPIHTAILLNNKGQVYEYMNELKTAHSLYETAYLKAITTTDTLEIARTLSNFHFLKARENPPAAEKGLLVALEMREKKGHLFEIASSYNHLTRFYQSINDTVAMNRYADKFLAIAQHTNMLDQLQSALRLKIETGQTQYALPYLKLSDSLTHLKETERNNFNYYVYQFDKKEKDLQRSRINNERLIYALLFIALMSGSVYFILKFKHKKEKIQEVFMTENRISRKVHDEVANDIYHLMTQLQTGTEDHRELLNHLESIYIRTRDISKQNSSIDLSIPFQDLLHDLFIHYKSEEVSVITRGLQSIPWNRLNDIQKSSLYRVLQELLTNMKKHSQATFVLLQFSFNNDLITIIYKDNGVGTQIKKGNGLQNTENRMLSIHGTITFDSEMEKGFKATITI